MNSVKFVLVVATITITVVPCAVIGTRYTGTIDGYVVFTDSSSTLRTRAQALAYCQSEGAELVKVTNDNFFKQLRMSFTTPGRYWIDGIDKNTPDRFELGTNCPGSLNINDFEESTFVIPRRSCLTLNRGTSAANTKIEAVDCISTAKVLCGYPLNGC